MELEELTRKRQEHIQSCRENNDNSHKIIAGQYSDPSHFIYELLQNADDAKASEVAFNLNLKSLEIKHNGKKLFDFHDVDSITTVGSSTKRDDVNSIGTFGSGFKSVFAITKTPSIHSGNYHFRIVDFIIPEKIEPLDTEEYTVISLPFNHPDISAHDVYQQLSCRLESLEYESLLFLRNIQEIQWSTESDRGHYLSEIKEDKATLISQVNDQDKSQDYILFKKLIELDDAKLSLSIAYPLDTDGSNQIIPVHESKLFVFFPTNERTGLRFLVHAPYKTTPSRESIPFEDKQNQIITDKLSVLIAESISSIKDERLLNVEFLAILPIEPENEHPLYKAAFQRVKETLISNQLLPTSGGGYTNSPDALLAREKELTTLLGEDDCHKLFERKFWLDTGITNDNTKALRDYITDLLDVPVINMQKFCREITDGFIETKSDKWIIDFYSNTTKNKVLYRESPNPRGVLRRKPIIRLENGSNISPENDAGDLQVYLPSSGKSKFKTVKRTIFESEEASEFLKSLGLEAPDGIAEIKELIIPKYQENYVEEDEYIEDFDRVLTIWSQSDEYRKKEVADALKQSQFIRCNNHTCSISFQKPEDVYFCTEKLQKWFKDNRDDNIYFLNMGVQLTEEIRKLLESLGVRYDMKIYGANEIRVNRYGDYKRSLNGFNPNFYIKGLDFALDNIYMQRSKILWSVLLKYPNKLRGHLETKTNQNHPYNKSEEKYSKAMRSLIKCSWLFNKENKLIDESLNLIMLDDLNRDYQLNDENLEKLIEALGFKLDEIRDFEEKTGKKVVSAEDYELLQKIKKEQNNIDSEQENKDNWNLEIDPDDANMIEDTSQFPNPKSKDLSGQIVEESSESNNKDKYDGEEEGPNDSNSHKSKNSKAIGDWGESIAKRYLEKKFPQKEVVWLNENGNVGKGCDFVIREYGKDIVYYEVKSKTDEVPQLFEISGTQWSWAQELHNTKRGSMYIILLVSNAGKKETKIREIKDPVELWKTGKIYADPVNIKL